MFCICGFSHLAVAEFNAASDAIGIGLFCADRDTLTCDHYGHGQDADPKRHEGPEFDFSAVVIKDAECGKANGSIKNLKIKNIAGLWKSQWLGLPGGPVDAPYDVINETHSLLGMKAGIYWLKFTDESGYPAIISAPIEIKEINGVSMDDKDAKTKQADCNGLDGQITGIYVTGATDFVWENASGDTIGTDQDLTNVPEGLYHLTASNGLCTATSRIFRIERTVSMKNYASTKVISAPTCGLANGKIEVIFAADSPSAIRWQNNKGESIGNTATLENLEAGDYDCYITNDLGCESFAQKYTVPYGSSALEMPVVNDMKTCSGGALTIKVLHPGTGIYLLSDENNREIAQSSNGEFNLNIDKTTSFKVIQKTSDCQSGPSTFKITIENEGLSRPPNTFSPNGDGQNDLWVVDGLSTYPNAVVSIFNRNGLKVFNSIGYNNPFDGRWQGADLPIGVYYYVIDLKKKCGTLSGSLTLIR